MRWVAAITACILLGVAGAGISLAASTPEFGPIDAEVEATLDAVPPADTPITPGPLAVR